MYCINFLQNAFPNTTASLSGLRNCLFKVSHPLCFVVWWSRIFEKRSEILEKDWLTVFQAIRQTSRKLEFSEFKRSYVKLSPISQIYAFFWAENWTPSISLFFWMYGFRIVNAIPVHVTFLLIYILTVPNHHTVAHLWNLKNLSSCADDITCLKVVTTRDCERKPI